MEKIFMILVLCVVVKASEDDRVPLLEKESCSAVQNKERNALIERAKCGQPKEVLVKLKPRAASEEIYPGAVWVKRCVGLCHHEGSESKCFARKVVIWYVPIKIYNVKTNKETCSSYQMQEHVLCGCCELGPANCVAPRVFYPRKCSCHCPNLVEHRACSAQQNSTMKWNRSKCICEETKTI